MEHQQQVQFDQFKKQFLLIQKKYEQKIAELSILKEMAESMKSIDLKDHDVIWIRQLDCLIKYKNLSAAVLYLENDFQHKGEKFISSSANTKMDYSFLKNSKIMQTIFQEAKPIYLEDLSLEEMGAGNLSGSLYILPVGSREEVLGALILISDEKHGFKKDDFLFYSIVRDQLVNTLSFFRFYFSKISEEKQMIQLSRFFSKDVVKKILKGGRPKLGGERKKASVIFVDLVGFTALSESLSSEEVVAILNNFFTCMIPLVFKNNGTMDKIIGDSIMAIFGAPISDDKSSFKAVKTSLDMFAAFHDFKKSRGGNYEKLGMTVGINTGDLVAGFFGSESHLSYTVIGDTVNSAQRLQSLAEKNQIYLSSNVYDDLRPDIDKLNNVSRIIPLGDAKVKGKKRVLNVYSIVPERK